VFLRCEMDLATRKVTNGAESAHCSYFPQFEFRFKLADHWTAFCTVRNANRSKIPVRLGECHARREVAFFPLAGNALQVAGFAKALQRIFG